MKIFATSLLASVLVSTALFGASYKVDNAHSTVGFEVKHMMSTSRGDFGDYTATFDYDSKTDVLDAIEASITASSIDTRNKKRDEHLKGEDFFNTGKFPTITFKSSKVSKKGAHKYLVQGNLTLKGITKPVTLTVTHNGNQVNPWGQDIAGFSAKGKIDRQAFGLIWNKSLDKGGLLIGNDIELVLQIEAVKQ